MAAIIQTYHFQSLLRPEEVEHGLQVFLDVVALALLSPARLLGLCREHQGRTLAREVTFAEAETNIRTLAAAGEENKVSVVSLRFN